MSGTTGITSGSATVTISEMLEVLNASAEVAGVPVSFGFLRNFTVEGVEPFLRYHSLAAGLSPVIRFGNYDMVQQEVLDPGSHLYTSPPDIIVVALFLETYLPDGWRGGWKAEEVAEGLAGLYNDLAGRTEGVMAINTFVPPFYSDFGITSAPGMGSGHEEVLRLNQMLREFVTANAGRFVLIDWERLLRIAGEAESMDYRFWYMSKAPFKKTFLDLYAQELVKVARALKGKAKKCLVLDCDNTLWGGVVGEDGVQGIKLGRHSYPGNAFYDFQKSVVRLKERGVLIALCSKNNEEDVWEVLDRHPDCLVKREHLSAWRVNWQDKASNIRSLAAELNLGLDSFVFVDDSPMECGLVRETVPEVTVLQVPDKLYSYPQLLHLHGLFDTLALSTEDRRRSRMYQEEASRKDHQAKFDTLDDYLASLSLSITVHPVRDEEIPRAAQLTQKTNQFNLTTRRYPESRFAAMKEDPGWELFTLSVSDKFGDSGLTGLLVARREGELGIVDSFLMSCRILGRNIEKVFVTHALASIAASWGCSQWRAEYIPTSKNQQVAQFWPSLGFEEVERTGEEVVYRLRRPAPELAPVSYIDIRE